VKYIIDRTLVSSNDIMLARHIQGIQHFLPRRCDPIWIHIKGFAA
jgi:hypothetical protein